MYCAKIFYFEYRFFFLKNFVFYKFLFKNQFRKKISFLNLNDFYFFYKKIKFFFCANPCIFFFKHLGLKKNKKFKFLLLSLNLKKINKFGLKIFVKNFNFRIIPIKIYDSFFYSKLVLKKIKFFISVNRYWRHIVRCWKIIKWPRFFDFYDCITHKLKSLDKKKKYQYFFFKYVSYSYRFLTLQTLS